MGGDLTTVPTLPGAYQTFYALLVDALEGRGPVPVHPWDAVRVLEVLEAARGIAASDHVVVGA